MSVNPNLDRLEAAQVSMSPDERERCIHMLIGWLSGSVDQKVWNTALDAAVVRILEGRMRRIDRLN